MKKKIEELFNSFDKFIKVNPTYNDVTLFAKVIHLACAGIDNETDFTKLTFEFPEGLDTLDTLKDVEISEAAKTLSEEYFSFRRNQ